MRAVSYEMAAELGIDTSMIKACAQIRKLAKLDRIKLDDSEHRSGLNKYLFRYIEYCGFDTLEFIKQYLSNLQPYMIERKKNQDKKDSFTCVIDKMYRISVYIKVDSTQFQELMVSFHEDNKRGVARDNYRVQFHLSRYVPVIIDSILSYSEKTEKTIVKVFVQRGMLSLPIELDGVKLLGNNNGSVFIVERDGIEKQFIGYCNEYIRDLYASDIQLENSFDEVEVFSMLQQISFTSYGKDTFSSLSLLIDSLTIQSGRASKSAADFALVTFAQNLKLLPEQKKELSELLTEKYKVTSITGIDVIIDQLLERVVGLFCALPSFAKLRNVYDFRFVMLR